MLRADMDALPVEDDLIEWSHGQPEYFPVPTRLTVDSNKETLPALLAGSPMDWCLNFVSIKEGEC
jgi:hypothetical protein